MKTRTSLTLAGCITFLVGCTTTQQAPAVMKPPVFAPQPQAVPLEEEWIIPEPKKRGATPPPAPTAVTVPKSAPTDRK